MVLLFMTGGVRCRNTILSDTRTETAQSGLRRMSANLWEMTDFTAPPSQILLKLPFVKLTKSPCKKGDFFVQNSLLTNARRCGIMAGRRWALRPVFRQFQVISIFLCKMSINECSLCPPIMDTCAPAEHECVGRFFPPYRPIWNFFAQSSGPIFAPNLPKTETSYGRCATNPEGIARKYVKYFFVKLTKYIFKKIWQPVYCILKMFPL